MKRHLSSSLVVSLALGGGRLLAQSPGSGDAVLTFHFERPAMAVPDYTLTVHEDGGGTYAATYAAPPERNGSSADAMRAAAPKQETRTLTLSHATTERLFEKARSTDHFRSGCESKQRNVANTGAKTLTYAGPDGTGTCTYNFSENKAVVGLTDTFQAIAETIDEGRTIDFKHRYDRLGLDAAMMTLVEAVKDGRASNIETIAPVLQSLVDDLQVLERVRKRATGLLQSISR